MGFKQKNNTILLVIGQHDFTGIWGLEGLKAGNSWVLGGLWWGVGSGVGGS